MRNTIINIDLETGLFLLSSNEVAVKKNDNLITWESLSSKEKYLFESEWDIEKNLLSFKMDGEDAFHLLADKHHPLHQLSVDARDHHLSVMRYERI